MSHLRFRCQCERRLYRALRRTHGTNQFRGVGLYLVGDGVSRRGAEQRRFAGALLSSHHDLRRRFSGASGAFHGGRVYSGRVHETVVEMDCHFWTDGVRHRRAELVQHDLSENVLSSPANNFSKRHLHDRGRIRLAEDR